MWIFPTISGTDQRVGTLKGKCFSFMFQCLQIFLFYTNIFSWAIFTCFARVLCVHVNSFINKFLDPRSGPSWNSLQSVHIAQKMHPFVTNLFLFSRYFLGGSTGRERNMNKPLMNWWVIKTKIFILCLRFYYCVVRILLQLLCMKCIPSARYGCTVRNAWLVKCYHYEWEWYHHFLDN